MRGSELRLSRRQEEVLKLVATGCTNKEIAHQLGLSNGTVKTYLDRIFRNKGFRNRAEAASWMPVRGFNQPSRP